MTEPWRRISIDFVAMLPASWIQWLEAWLVRRVLCSAMIPLVGFLLWANEGLVDKKALSAALVRLMAAVVASLVATQSKPLGLACAALFVLVSVTAPGFAPT